MASADALCKKLLNVKNAVVESHDIYNDQDGVTHIRIKARPNVWHKNDCPFCGRHCQGYDQPTKKLQTATFCGQQGRISRTVRAILNGQPGRSAGQRVLRPTDQY